MSGRASPLRRIAFRIAAHAARALPRGRAAWAQAMRNETHYLPTGRSALIWALGCVLASYKERLTSMESGTAEPSRPVLTLEILLGFGVLAWSFLWLLSPFGQALVPKPDWFFFVSMSIVGPVGTWIGIRFVFFDPGPLSRGMTLALSITAAWALVAYSAFLLSKGTAAAGGWRELFLIGGLPVLTTFHLIWLSSRRKRIQVATG